MPNLQNKKILVTGGHGFLGSWVIDKLRSENVTNIFSPRSGQYDLRKKSHCKKAVKSQDVVIHIAANVGGIALNKDHPGKLFYDNSAMGIHLIDEAYRAGVKKMVIIGTACSYPKFCKIPFREADFWYGYPEEVTGVYGMAKKILLVQAQAYRKEYGFNAIYLILVNLYGPRDNFDPKYGHVIPSLIRRMVEAKRRHSKKFVVWGSGLATREFLYVEDAARGIVQALKYYDGGEPVNIGTGKEISISDLVKKIKDMVGYDGEIIWDPSKPDGQPRRVVDITQTKNLFHFEARVSLDEGLEKTLNWYLKHKLTK